MTTYHQLLPSNDIGRDFIVGDLHGCLDLLQAELTRIEFDRSKDRLFSVGDLVDRGPDSMGCLRRSEEHTSELQSLMRTSYAVFCLKKKKTKNQPMHI